MCVCVKPSLHAQPHDTGQKSASRSMEKREREQELNHWIPSKRYSLPILLLENGRQKVSQKEQKVLFQGQIFWNDPVFCQSLTNYREREYGKAMPWLGWHGRWNPGEKRHKSLRVWTDAEQCTECQRSSVNRLLTVCKINGQILFAGSQQRVKASSSQGIWTKVSVEEKL